MKENRPPVSTIDDYIAEFPPEIQDILQKIRITIKSAAPDAEEKISYQMPTFVLYGNLVHFAAFKNHIGFYPTPSGVDGFKDELVEYVSAKGSIQFPLSSPIPYDLISRIVTYRVAENTKNAYEKKNRK